VKKTILDSLDTVPNIDVAASDLTADGPIRGQHLRANLKNVFETYRTVPVHYLFTAIDAYTMNGLLRKRSVLLDTTASIILPDRAGACGIVGTSVAIIIDMNKCAQDKEVLTVLGHQMAHACNYITTGKQDLHDHSWKQWAENFVMTLGLPDIAYEESTSCFQALQPRLITL
jgi:hypothetical protein